MLMLDGAGATTFLGFDFVRLHAMLNDLPAALLLAAVVFEALYIFTKKDGLRYASFWTLMAGILGAGAATWAGLQAEGAIEHGTAIHEIMEQHERLAFITVGVFAVVAAWRLWRERKMSMGERQIALVMTLVGTGLLYTTGKLGGQLVFDHAAGIPLEVMEREMKNRAAGHEHAPGEEHEHPETAPDTAQAGGIDSSAGDHDHAPGTPEHKH